MGPAREPRLGGDAIGAPYSPAARLGKAEVATVTCGVFGASPRFKVHMCTLKLDECVHFQMCTGAHYRNCGHYRSAHVHSCFHTTSERSCAVRNEGPACAAEVGISHLHLGQSPSKVRVT